MRAKEYRHTLEKRETEIRLYSKDTRGPEIIPSGQKERNKLYMKETHGKSKVTPYTISKINEG